MKAEINMKGGDISGPSKEFYEDGTLKKESNLSGQAPEFTSQTKLYSKNGKLQQTGSSSRKLPFRKESSFIQLLAVRRDA